MKKTITENEAQAIAGIMRAKRERLQAESISMAKAAIEGGFDYASHPCIINEIEALWPAWRSYCDAPMVGGGQGRDPWDMRGRGQSNVVGLVLALIVLVLVGLIVGWVVVG